jgi:hypothetical protein
MLNVAPDAFGEPLDDRFRRPRRLVFGIGAQKSGTTWLASYLSGHPDIHMSPRKELHYWSVIRGAHYRRTKLKNDRDRARSALGGSLLERLRNRFDGLTKGQPDSKHAIYARLYDQPAAPHSNYADALFLDYKGQPVAGEFTPAYATLSVDGYREMAALAPDVRFVFVMRDPVARLVSGIRHFARGEIGSANVTPQIVRDRILASLADPEHFDVVRSRHDLTIAQLEAAVGADKVFYLFYETMFQQSEMDRLCDFLDIAPALASVDRRVNGGRDTATVVDEDLSSVMRTALTPVYDFMRQRFGSLPQTWSKVGAKIGERKLEG